VTTPDFNDLTPPYQDLETWSPPAQRAIIYAYRDGARHGYGEARQLWPEPITDRPPTEADGDDAGYVQFQNELGRWNYADWGQVAEWGLSWLHTPRWQPRQPSLQEQALAALEEVEKRVGDRLNNFDLIRRALETLND
jgi:hypothetical protein